MVMPALLALVVGGINAGLLVYSAAGLQAAAQQAARCYSIGGDDCGSAGAAEDYAQRAYFGINTPAFTASMQTCGHQVTGSVAVALTAVVVDLTVPLTATACFP